MSKITGLIVGMHFRPPAKWVLDHLPTGTELRLEAEPENPYDEKALKVLIDPKEIPESEWESLGEDLLGTGYELEELLKEDWIWLGYVAATGGKPLHGTSWKGNVEFGERLMDRFELRFSPEGKPLIVGEEWPLEGGEDDEESF